MDEALTEQVRTAMPYAATLGLELIAASKDEVHAARRVGRAADNGGRDPARRRPDGARRHRRRLLRVPQPAGGLDLDGHDRVEDELLLRRPLGAVEARSRPLHRGSRTIVVETDLFDESGKHVARVTQTQAVL